MQKLSLGTTVTAVTVNAGDVSELSKYSVDKVLKVNNDKLSGLLQKPMLMLSNKLHKRKRKVSLLSSTTDSIYLSSLVAVALEAGYASNGWITVLNVLLSSKRNAFQIKHSILLRIATR
jgi:electron transfer flavoprotein alpha subunit